LVREALGGREVEIFLCVRSYPEFFSSLYAEAMRHGHRQPIEQFLSLNDSPAGSWVKLVGTIQKWFPQSRIVVWSYESFARLQAEIVKRISGVPLDALRPLAEANVRPSASVQAIRMQIERVGKLTHYQRVLSMAVLERKFPITDRSEKFSPWSKDAEDAMHAAYQEDLHALKRRPNIDFLG
jgi:hypothetical protein